MSWWPWHKEIAEPEPDNGDLDEARAARKRSEEDLRDARSQRSEVERIADRIREIRQQNHLAEIFEASIKRRRESG